jgi:hypothetical protein
MGRDHSRTTSGYKSQALSPKRTPSVYLHTLSIIPIDTHIQLVSELAAYRTSPQRSVAPHVYIRNSYPDSNFAQSFGVTLNSKVNSLGRTPLRFEPLSTTVRPGGSSYHLQAFNGFLMILLSSVSARSRSRNRNQNLLKFSFHCCHHRFIRINTTSITRE